MLDPALHNRPRDPTDVVVTVTTRRYDELDSAAAWSRQSVATGPFDQAVLDALATRLHPWALAQVAGKVLARRPATGESIDYLGRFSDVRELIIAVRPIGYDVASPPPKTRPLRGLFLDYSVQRETEAAPLTRGASELPRPFSCKRLDASRRA